MTRKTTQIVVTAGYDAMLADVVELIAAGRRAVVRTSNAFMTTTYWAVGRGIVEEEQGGSRADDGEVLIARLARDLTSRFGRGFGQRNVCISAPSTSRIEKRFCRQRLQNRGPRRYLTNSRRCLQNVAPEALAEVAGRFPLPWSHYVRLLGAQPRGPRFYETEALRGGWTIRQLDRQIGSQFYERTALSRNKAAMLRKGQATTPDDAVTPEEEIKDPYVLEFLDLKDEYSRDRARGRAHRASSRAFLLELGGDFTFVGRQRRLRVGDEWYRIDLLFFHRRLRCLVIIDLKLGKFTHADAGQMHLYLNYAREHWMLAGENPPVGLILCAEKDSAGRAVRARGAAEQGARRRVPDRAAEGASAGRRRSRRRSRPWRRADAASPKETDTKVRRRKK